MAPAIDVIPHPQNFGFNDRPACLLRGKVGARQENLTHSDHLVHTRLVAGAANLVIEERHRDLDVDARTIPCLAIRIHSTTVPDCFQRLDAVLDHFA